MLLSRVREEGANCGALARHGKPEVFNTDQCSQFTCSVFTEVLVDNGIAIRMDGKGALRDSAFVDGL